MQAGTIKIKVNTYVPIGQILDNLLLLFEFINQIMFRHLKTVLIVLCSVASFLNLTLL